MKKINACLVGISGYAGMELARLLAAHPFIQLNMACSRAEAGKRLGDFYPFLNGLQGSEIIISVYEKEKVIENCDLAFLAVPAGKAMQMAEDLIPGGVKVIDFSADFRLENHRDYECWYHQPHICPELIKDAVYGLPELYADKIQSAKLVANPGCYPTASILGLAPALKNSLVNADGIIIDAKSGATGAGRKAAIPNLFCEISDNFRAYGVPGHRHTPEIEQELSKLSETGIKIMFTPHLVPMKRGILATIYTFLKNSQISQMEILQIFRDYWKNAQWIRILDQLPQTANVRGSMFCDICPLIDSRTGRLIIFSAIDNLCRGAAGQALANANIMCELDMTSGMTDLCPIP